MLTEKVRGIVLISIAVAGLSIYAYFLFATGFDILLMKITIVTLIAIMFFIVGWIGFTLTTSDKNNQEGLE
jgi:hypothetical protein